VFDPDVTGSGDTHVVWNFDIMSFDWTDDANSWLYLETAILEQVSFGTP
jgi:hypothetical protein